MARRNISLPDDLDDEARRAHLNVSSLAQRAVAEELDRKRRMEHLDAWLDELDLAHGTPSVAVMESAREWFDSATAVRPKGSASRKAKAPHEGPARRAAG